MRINKARINLFVDAAFGIAFCAEVLSGIVLALVLPRGGYRGGQGYPAATALALDRHQWLLLHDWFALFMLLGVLGHLALHWRWISCMMRNTWRDAFASRSTNPVCETQPR